MLPHNHAWTHADAARGDSALASRRQWMLAAYWFSLNFQTAGLLTIVLPRILNGLAGAEHTLALSRLATLGAAVGIVVPPLVGVFSDRMRHRGGRRTPLLLAGTAVNVVGLLWMQGAGSLGALTIGFLVTSVGRGGAGAAFEAIMPEAVDSAEWGRASGHMGVATLLGTIGGLGVAALMPPGEAFTLMMLTAIGGALITWGVREDRHVWDEHDLHTVPPPAQAPDTSQSPARSTSLGHRVFAVVFLARFLVIFGQTLLMTYILYFFQDVLGVDNPSASTAVAAALCMAGAGASALLMGKISDRVPRQLPVFVAGLFMAAAALGFSALPELRLILAFAVVYGLGYGTFLSVDWALALDSLPSLQYVARDLGIWGLASDLPSLLAPAAGGWIIYSAALPSAGYHHLFEVSGASLVAGSLVVLAVRRASALEQTADADADPAVGRDTEVVTPLWAIPVALAICGILRIHTTLTCRVRTFGRILRRNGATLVVANHTHDLDSTILPPRLFLDGTLRQVPRMVASARLDEPGFLGWKAPEWLYRLLGGLQLGPFLRGLGMVPIEPEPRRRALWSWAYHLWRAYGNLPLADVLEPEAWQRLQPRVGGAAHGSPRLADIWRWRAGRVGSEWVSLRDIRDPYRTGLRRALRPQIEGQLNNLQKVLLAGSLMYITPEGDLTQDGRLGRFRQAFDRLLAAAPDVWLAAVAYDVFAPGRLPVYVRLVAPADSDRIRESLAAARPVTASQLVATAVLEHGGPGVLLRGGTGAPAGGAGTLQTEDEAVLRTATHLLQTLPERAFLAPALRQDAQRSLAAALTQLRRLAAAGERARNGAWGVAPAADGARAAGAPSGADAGTVVRHPRFPHMPDMLASQANMFSETCAALQALGLNLPGGC